MEENNRSDFSEMFHDCQTFMKHDRALTNRGSEVLELSCQRMVWRKIKEPSSDGFVSVNVLLMEKGTCSDQFKLKERI